jgi:hypothetical protein
MSNKERVLEVLQTAKAIVRTVLSDGLYPAQKVNDDYVILHETSEGWRELGEGQTAETVIVLTDVLDRDVESMKTTSRLLQLNFARKGQPA